MRTTFATPPSDVCASLASMVSKHWIQRYTQVITSLDLCC